jgi:NTP pyrophosphatase (non-canonical NTP hydrolase)
MPEPMDWQREVAGFARAHGLLHDPATHALDLASEVGEVAKAVLLATDYGRRPLRGGAELSGELGDALYALLALAEVCGVDAGWALSDALGKLRRRLDFKETPGST